MPFCRNINSSYFPAFAYHEAKYGLAYQVSKQPAEVQPALARIGDPGNFARNLMKI